MSNPTINFRLSKYQMARGLQIIRQLEPDYHLTSLSKLVKTIYLDYLAKMSLNKSDMIPQHYLDEIESLVFHSNKPILTLQDFAKIHATPKEEKSIKTTVENFRPPKDWTDKY